MTQATGTTRPGGRSARTRRAVHEAVRSLLDESPDGVISVADVAERSGVHPATIYRRWRGPEGLVLDTLFEELSRRSPLPVTGDLGADMLAYARSLLTDLHQEVNLLFLRSLVTAARPENGGLAGLGEYAEPRVRQIEAILTASGAAEIGVEDVLELMLAPAYMCALLDYPMDPATDAERLVDNLLAVLDRRRSRSASS
ncbi:TetR/AcrR family transcriptional regulator [Streptomyces sp. NPDC052040]|uniref:TetR/AcrR family transcriptional regulator n=1 Tax=Streptomyces sp. NPDC052040 TaxID=3365682 RepID=UPI0037D375C9